MSRILFGKIQKVYHGNCRAKYEWIVPDFFSVSHSRWTCAPAFECYGVNWEFRAHSPRGRLYLCLSREDDDPGSIRFVVGIRRADGSDEVAIRDRRIPEGARGWCLRRVVCYLELERLRPELPPTGELTVACKIIRDRLPSPGGLTFTSNEAEKKHSPVACGRSGAKSVVSVEIQSESASGTDGRMDQLVAHLDLEEKTFAAQETQTEEALDAEVKEERGGKFDTTVDPSLEKHLKDLLLSGDDHDITIHVRNREFRAHRGMLRARSPVFAAMFKHDTKERACGSISIDDCDPDAFGEFLHYVYTGRVEDLSPGKATGLYYIGDKYDFSGLKEVCLQFLEASLSKTSMCDVIHLATTHGESGLLEKAISFFSENTVEILKTVEWQRFAVKNVVAANELCIKAFEGLVKKK